MCALALTPAHPSICRQPSQAAELQGLENVSVTQVDISSPQSVEQWAAEVQQLTPHIDVRLHGGSGRCRPAGSAARCGALLLVLAAAPTASATAAARAAAAVLLLAPGMHLWRLEACISGNCCSSGSPTQICCQPLLQYVINNAGVYSRLTGLEGVTAADMLADFTTNCIGPLLAVQQLHK